LIEQEEECHAEEVMTEEMNPRAYHHRDEQDAIQLASLGE